MLVQKPSFSIFLMHRGEELVLGGTSTLIREAGVAVIETIASYGSLNRAEIKIHENKRNCQLDPNVTLSR